jgi:osmotically-inducible protein OsmY
VCDLEALSMKRWLIGRVSSEAVKSEAERIARGTKGVRT